MDAQIILEILCFYNVKNYIQYRKQIVDFWKELAEEGLPLARRIYGEILYKGIEVPKNMKLGLEFLKKCRRNDAYIALYKHYHHVEKDLKTSRYYLWLSIKNDYPDAIYELGLSEMEAKNYDEAIKLFKKTIILQDNHWKAKFALANIYATRCLSNIKCEKMPETVKLFQEAQKETYDEEAKQSIIERLSFIKKYYPNLF